MSSCNNNMIQFIDWSNFKNIKTIEKGVLPNRICCIMVEYNGNKKVLKEMDKGMNYGLDYTVIDKCKHIFGLNHMNIIQIKSNKGLVKIDKTSKTYVDNNKIDDKDCIYCMMDYWENIGCLGKNKDKLNNVKIIKECLKIRYFDGLFRSSDNVMRNILINCDGELLSIDEDDLFGKRKYIFNMNGDWCRDKCDKELIDEVIDDLLENKDEYKEKVNEVMIQYGMDHHCKEFNERFDNYREIVDNEWDIY